MRDLTVWAPERVEHVAAADSPEDFLSWNDLSGLLRRHWIAVAGFTVLAVAIGVAYITATPRKYEDTATVLIEKEQYNIPEIVTHDATDLGVVSTEMEVLRSDRLGAQVARDLALNVTVDGSRLPRSALFESVALVDSDATGRFTLDRDGGGKYVIHNETTGATSSPISAGVATVFGPLAFTLEPGLQVTHVVVNVIPVMAAARALQADLKVGRGERDANVIWARYRSTDPILATTVPRTLAREYVAHRVVDAKAKAVTAVRFLQEQADTLQRQLVDADQQLRDFRQRAGVVSLSEEASTAVTSAAQLRLNRGTIEAERNALQQLVASSDTSASAYRGITAFPTLIANPTVSNLLHSVDDLQGQRTELLLRRTSNDPDVQALDRRIADADRQLRRMTRTYLAGLSNQVGALDRSIATQTKAAASIPEKSMTEDQLSRRPKVLEDVYSLVETRLQEARIAESVADPGVSIIDASTSTGLPVWPRPGLIMAVALIGGALGGIALAWLREGMDDAVHSRADIARIVAGPVLTVVPHIRGASSVTPLRDGTHVATGALPPPMRLLGTARQRRRHSSELIAAGAVEEAYTWLETSLAFTGQQNDNRVVAVTSPLAREGKTVSACNLALSAARHGRRVLLIDGDLRRGHVHDLFSVDMAPGVTDALSGPTLPQQVLRHVAVGGKGALDVIPRGRHAEHPAGLLKGPGFRALIDGMRPAYDMVVIDCPPVNLISDPLMVAPLADGVVLVARAGVTDGAALSQAAEHLRNAGATLLGVVLNDIDLHRDSSYDGSYRYLDQAGAYATSDA
ncbi:MAG TPA: polysaccharide biosynthesis tyrosine autokinase [Gemmatimonadales bacterium]|jgi:tyrosine-protein kinase Etk/Wzc